jgi:hypothetical protein
MLEIIHEKGAEGFKRKLSKKRIRVFGISDNDGCGLQQVYDLL